MATKTTKSVRDSSTGKRTSRRAASAPNKKSKRTAINTRPRTRSGSSKRSGTPPAGSVAAAQKVLRTVERREDTLRKAVKRHKNPLKQLKKTLSGHRDTVKSLKTDLAKVSKTRKSVSSSL